MFGQGVRGINDAALAELVADVPGDNTDIIGIKNYSVAVTSDSDEQRGDDAVIMVVQENKSLDVTVGSAYANIAVLGVVTGYTVVAGGSGAAETLSYKEPASANTRYVQITGQAKGRDTNGSALRLTVLKAQLTGGPNFDFSEGAWMEPELTFTGVGRGDPSYLFELLAMETEVAIPIP